MLKALSNAAYSNGIGDADKTPKSLVVHPERIVIPLRTLKSSLR
jgi:hypothetical protein